MTERVCVVCPVLHPASDPRHYDRPMVCEGCRRRLHTLLAEIVDLYATLPEHLERGQAEQQRVSGSREAPLPLRVDALDLTLSVRTGVAHEPPCTCREPRPECRPGQPHNDQAGQTSAAAILDSWTRDWCEHRGKSEHPPVPTVTTLVVWLTDRLDDACNTHPAIDEFATELRNLHHALRSVTGVTDIRPEPIRGVPCRRCDLLTLMRLPGQDRVECGNCHDLLTEDEYRRWVGLMAAEAQPA